MTILSSKKLVLFYRSFITSKTGVGFKGLKIIYFEVGILFSFLEFQYVFSGDEAPIWSKKQLSEQQIAEVGAFSTKQDFICGDLDGVINWIEGEAEFQRVTKNEKEFHIALEEAGRAEEATESESLIGMFKDDYTLYIKTLYSITNYLTKVMKNNTQKRLGKIPKHGATNMI
ncbi:hypothetical protein ACJX0J_037110 [Zea mays]